MVDVVWVVEPAVGLRKVAAQQKGGQHPNQGNDHKEFNKGKAAAAVHWRLRSEKQSVPA